MAKGLTVAAVKNFKPGTQRREIPDGIMPGLYLIVQTSGVKSWALRYRIGGKPAKYTIGRYPVYDLAEAREEAAKLQRQVARGEDPNAARKAAKLASEDEQSDLFEDVVAEFIEKHAMVKTKTGPATARIFAKRFTPHFKGRRAQDVTRKEIRKILNDLVDSGMGLGVNRILAAIRKMYSWLLENDRIDHSPCDKIKPPVSEESRTRVLTDYELALLWRAAREIDYPNGPFIECLILTGQRLNEVARAEWKEFARSETGLEWTLPDRRVKNNRDNNLKLPAQLIELFDALPRVSGCPYLFTTTGQTPISGFSKLKKRLDKMMLEFGREDAVMRGENPDEFSIPPYRLHDVRRTATTGMAKLKVLPHVAEGILNHKSGTISGVAAIYNRWEYYDEKADGLQVWANHVDHIVRKYAPVIDWGPAE